MKTKIVYVLVSTEADYYYEMTRLSLCSLRLHHPKDTVEIVMDEQTHQRLAGRKDKMLEEATPVVVSIPAEYTVMQRSRFLKTRLRQIVNGDFLYIDGDTLICEPLDDIDRIEVEIGMVYDENGGG